MRLKRLLYFVANHLGELWHTLAHTCGADLTLFRLIFSNFSYFALTSLPLTPPWTRSTLQQRLAVPIQQSDPITGDGTHLERLEAHRLQGRSVRAAAVLVLLIEERDGLHVVLTQRTDHLSDHAGQISFPGGRKDDGDVDLIATALREAQEEIGANASEIEIIGELPRYVTITAYEISPIVAISAPQVFTADPFEVAAVFSVPLSHFLNEKNWKRDSFFRDGLHREFWAVPYVDDSGERNIWGATAGMLRVLALHLRGDL